MIFRFQALYLKFEVWILNFSKMFWIKSFIATTNDLPPFSNSLYSAWKESLLLSSGLCLEIKYTCKVSSSKISKISFFVSSLLSNFWLWEFLLFLRGISIIIKIPQSILVNFVSYNNGKFLDCEKFHGKKFQMWGLSTTPHDWYEFQVSHDWYEFHVFHDFSHI